MPPGQTQPFWFAQTVPYIQDIWQASDRVRVQYGARYDHYSDFGSTINPRAGVHLKMSDRWDLRLSHGTAFRAPDFYSQFVKNNPIVTGNPDLEPEEIRTSEISAGFRVPGRSYTHLTIFYSSLCELIAVMPGTNMYGNNGDADVLGAELGTHVDIGKRGRLSANYCHPRAGGDPVMWHGFWIPACAGMTVARRGFSDVARLLDSRLRGNDGSPAGIQ